MKFRCTHCNHEFTLSERDYRCCPSCYWTTALEELPDLNQEPTALPKTVEKPKGNATKPKSQFDFTFLKTPLLILLATVLVIGAGYYIFFFIKKVQPTSGTAIQIKKTERKESKKTATEQIQTLVQKEALSIGSLPEADKQILTARFQMTIPRKLDASEEQILKQQVQPPAILTDMPKLYFWNKEDFKKMLAVAQQTRGIPLGWLYIRNLNKLFDEHYMRAAKAVETNDMAAARDALIQAVILPVYQNDIKMHRAIALVMLRPYINDVIGKIAALNQHLTSQQTLAEAKKIYQTHDNLIAQLDLQDWDKAAGLMNQLRAQMDAVEKQAQNENITYPPALQQVDQEIQQAIIRDGKPAVLKEINFTALKSDLDAKEKVVKRNSAENLAAIQKSYGQALRLIEESQWDEAYRLLQSIDYPSELVLDVKQKTALIEKLKGKTNG